MIFYFLFLFLGFIAFLFTLFEVGKDDTLFIRKGITPDTLFSIAFLAVGVGLFFSRVFFVVLHFAMVYLNPLVFFLIFYYPGLSFPGGLLSAVTFLILYARAKKMPLGHTVDFFGLSLLSAMPFGYVANLFIEPFSPFKHIFLPVLVAIIFVFTIVVLLQRTIRHELRSGTLGATAILVVSFITFLTSLLSSVNRGSLALLPADIISLIMFVLSLVFFIKQEYIFAKVKK